MKTGEIIKNGTSTFVVLATEENKALLLRITDGETVVAVSPKKLESSTSYDVDGKPFNVDSYEWEHGHYYGKYMDTVLSMVEGLKQYRNPDEKVYVKTSKERAEFLASFGDETYECPLLAIAENEAINRVNQYIKNSDDLDELSEAHKEECVGKAEVELYQFLMNNEGAFNYDGMDDIVAKIMEEYVDEVLASKSDWEPNAHEKALIEKIEDAKRYVEGELELSFQECIPECNYPVDGWYVMDYKASYEASFRVIANGYDKSPIISQEMAVKNHVAVRKCCDACNVYYVG